MKVQAYGLAVSRVMPSQHAQATAPKMTVSPNSAPKMAATAAKAQTTPTMYRATVATPCRNPLMPPILRWRCRHGKA